jgi:hypothetical protein
MRSSGKAKSNKSVRMAKTIVWLGAADRFPSIIEVHYKGHIATL